MADTLSTLVRIRAKTIATGKSATGVDGSDTLTLVTERIVLGEGPQEFEYQRPELLPLTTPFLRIYPVYFSTTNTRPLVLPMKLSAKLVPTKANTYSNIDNLLHTLWAAWKLAGPIPPSAWPPAPAPTAFEWQPPIIANRGDFIDISVMMFMGFPNTIP